MFNKIIITYCTMLIIRFSDWPASENLKFFIGWFYCVLILLHILANMLVVLYYSLRRMRFTGKNIYRRVHRCFGKKPPRGENSGGARGLSGNSQ